MDTGDIAGYTFNADEYCDEDMRDIARRKLPELGVATMYGDCGSAEDMLHDWAMALGIDRSDENTFDSGDFPKIIGTEMTHKDCGSDDGCNSRCARCGEPLGGECPDPRWQARRARRNPWR